VEPFAGSSALFFYLKPDHGLLGDINAELIAFYHVLAHRPGALAKAFRLLDPSGADYYAIRLMPPESMPRTMAAATFLYLNRFSFNGVYRTNRDGRFNVPRGSNTGALPTFEELKIAAQQLRKAKVANVDFEETLDATKKSDFVYIDPPYFTRRGIRPGEYGCNSLDGTDDLMRLVGALERLSVRGVRYLLSYSVSPALVRLAQPDWIRYVGVRRHVGGAKSRRKLGREMLIANYRPPGFG
jgi:DNA adenine methylase